MFAVVMVLLWWRARRAAPRAMAAALAAPAATVLGYLANEAAKHLKEVERPCRMIGDVVTIAPCPEPGDWSFPSNHAAVAGAAAAAIWWAGRSSGLRWPGAVAAPVALAAAALRVVVGAHFPHDVVVGLVVGAVVAAATAPVLARVAEPLVRRRRERSAGPLLVGPGSG